MVLQIRMQVKISFHFTSCLLSKDFYREVKYKLSREKFTTK